MNLLNATPFTVTTLDGRSESLSLARLSIRQLYLFSQHLASERIAELVSLCTGKPVAWIDTLTDEAYAELVQKLVELNFTRASTVAKADPALAIQLMPFVQKVQTLMVLGSSLGLNLNPPSPAPACSASEAVTGSASSTTPPDASLPCSPSTGA